MTTPERWTGHTQLQRISTWDYPAAKRDASLILKALVPRHATQDSEEDQTRDAIQPNP